jgi:hypothetical protein
MTRRLSALVVLLPFMFSTMSRAQGPSDPGAPNASWARLNGRVLNSGTGQPVANLPVLLQCSWLDGRWGRLAGTTDANGQFTIGTPAGQCALALNVPPGASIQGPGLRLFEFAPGETVETVRRFDPSPWSRPLDGRVLDDRGDQVSGARVIPRQSVIRAGSRQWTTHPPVRTDAGGAFRLPSVWPGSWEILVPALGLSRSVEVPRSAPAAALSPESIVIRGARLPVFRVSGLVETPAGAPQRFTPVYLDRGDSSFVSPVTIAETASDDAGRFAFVEVPVGAYRIRTDTSPTRPVGPGNAPGEIVWGFTSVVVASDVSGVTLTARPGPELRAEVRLDDGSLEPGQRVLLLVDAVSGRFVPTMLAIDGYLITRGLVPDRYRIRSTGVPAGYRVRSVTTGGRDVTQEGFDLRDGPIGDMVITLTKQLTEVKGVVRDAQDRPDGEAAVLAFPTNRKLWTDTGQLAGFIASAQVSQKGNFSLKGLPSGEYFVVATFSDPFLTTDGETLQQLAPFAERIRLADGGAVTLDLRTVNRQ